MFYFEVEVGIRQSTSLSYFPSLEYKMFWMLHLRIHLQSKKYFVLYVLRHDYIGAGFEGVSTGTSATKTSLSNKVLNSAVKRF